MIGKEIIDVSPEQIAKQGFVCITKPKKRDMHNHEVTPPKFTHLHPLYRKISEADSAQLDALQSHGIRTCITITKKDLYNYFDKKMCGVIKDGDGC